MDKTPSERLRLTLDDPSQSLHELAVQLRNEGMTQQEMYQLFDQSRTIHQNDPDESKYNAILDVMDMIVGWCRPSDALFPGESLPEDDGLPQG